MYQIMQKMYTYLLPLPKTSVSRAVLDRYNLAGPDFLICSTAVSSDKIALICKLLFNIKMYNIIHNEASIFRKNMAINKIDITILFLKNQ